MKGDAVLMRYGSVGRTGRIAERTWILSYRSINQIVIFFLSLLDLHGILLWIYSHFFLNKCSLVIKAQITGSPAQNHCSVLGAACPSRVTNTWELS